MEVWPSGMHTVAVLHVYMMYSSATCTHVCIYVVVYVCNSIQYNI